MKDASYELVYGVSEADFYQRAIKITNYVYDQVIEASQADKVPMTLVPGLLAEVFAVTLGIAYVQAGYVMSEDKVHGVCQLIAKRAAQVAEDIWQAEASKGKGRAN